MPSPGRTSPKSVSKNSIGCSRKRGLLEGVDFAVDAGSRLNVFQRSIEVVHDVAVFDVSPPGPSAASSSPVDGLPNWSRPAPPPQRPVPSCSMPAPMSCCPA